MKERLNTIGKKVLAHVDTAGRKVETFIEDINPILFFITCFSLMAIIFTPLIMLVFSPSTYEPQQPTSSSNKVAQGSADAEPKEQNSFMEHISGSISKAIDIMPSIDNQKIIDAITPIETAYFYDVSAHTTEELIAKIDELDYTRFDYDKYSNNYIPDIVPESDDTASIVKLYLDLYNNGNVSDWTNTYMGLELGIGGYGTLIVNGEPTNLKSNRGILTDIAKELYFRGVWDAPEVTYGNHTFGVSQHSGSLLLDGHLAESQLPIDRPDNWSEIGSSNYEYVPEKGLYGVVNQRLVKFLRGEIVYLPGGKLVFSGIDFSKEQICNIRLRYTEYSDNFFLFVDTCPIGIEVDEYTYIDLFYNDYDKLTEYFYAIPDADVSRLKFYAKLSNFYWFGSSSSTEGILSEEIRYCDSYGRWYLLTENGFVPSTNPYPEDNCEK